MYIYLKFDRLNLLSRNQFIYLLHESIKIYNRIQSLKYLCHKCIIHFIESNHIKDIIKKLVKIFFVKTIIDVF